MGPREKVPTKRRGASLILIAVLLSGRGPPEASMLEKLISSVTGDRRIMGGPERVIDYVFLLPVFGASLVRRSIALVKV